MRYSDNLKGITWDEAKKAHRAANRRLRKYSADEIWEAFLLVQQGIPTTAMLEIVEGYCLSIRTDPD